MPQGLYVDLDAVTLAAMETESLALIKAIKVAHQAYSTAGRSYSRASLPLAMEELAEIKFALALRSRTGRREVVADVSHGP